MKRDGLGQTENSTLFAVTLGGIRVGALVICCLAFFCSVVGEDDGSALVPTFILLDDKCVYRILVSFPLDPKDHLHPMVVTVAVMILRCERTRRALTRRC